MKITSKPQKRTILFANRSSSSIEGRFKPPRTFHLYFPEFVFNLIELSFENLRQEFYLRPTTLPGKLLPLPNIITEYENICIGKIYFREREKLHLWLTDLGHQTDPDNLTDTEILNDYIQTFWQTTFCVDSDLLYKRWCLFFSRWQKNQYKTWDEIFSIKQWSNP